ITRGVPLPGQPLRQRVPGAGPPTVFGYAAPLPALPPADATLRPATRRVALLTDGRWLRGRLKSISLLGSVLAAIEADEAGCDDAILVRNGLVAEATASNVVIWS